ncbi:hypothetical protein AVEN_34664-1 [Araneus ventricosus]|uniref:Uncharacterized protein n=1 Tax=Araneus ventricosus TaxID=182803 RepID=A0A4Y2B218_ARAVE|nr:hypothetical protein AVEN_34664-1 [Araneus ventricosus]
MCLRCCFKKGRIQAFAQPEMKNRSIAEEIESSKGVNNICLKFKDVRGIKRRLKPCYSEMKLSFWKLITTGIYSRTKIAQYNVVQASKKVHPVQYKQVQ